MDFWVMGKLGKNILFKNANMRRGWQKKSNLDKDRLQTDPCKSPKISSWQRKAYLGNQIGKFGSRPVLNQVPEANV